MRLTKIVTIGLLVILSSGIGLAIAATPPALINYQGVLRDAADDPVDGIFDMEFLFYDIDGGGSCSAGTLLLKDSHMTAGSGGITVTGGLFNTQLGGGTITAGTSSDLEGVFRDNGSVYLEVWVDGEMLCPRVEVLATGYSLNASNLDGESADFYKARDNHTGTQLPSTVSPQGAGSGLDADTVDGMHAADLIGAPGPAGPPGPPPSYAKYVVVALSGGDYADPIAAVANIDSGDAWCGTPSASNRCLIRIMPGVYDLGAAVFPGVLAMRSFVDMEGSGQNVTTLTATGTDSAAGNPATVSTATDAELRNLSVESTGGSFYANAITGSGTLRVSQLRDVTAIAGGGTSSNTAIVNQNTQGGLPVFRNITAIASGAGATGIHNSCSASDIDGAVVNVTGTGTIISIRDSNDPVGCAVPIKGSVSNVRAVADGGTNALALNASQSHTTFRNVSLTAMNGSSKSEGINIGANANVVILNSSIEATGSPTAEAIVSISGGTISIDHSTLSASSATINVAGSPGSVMIGATKMSGGAAVSSVPMTCAGVYDETNTFSASTCP
jgi:hypothetical protein